MDSNQILINASKFVNFLNKSPTPFHVVDSARHMLREAGFAELKLTEHWKPTKLGKYFVTKNESTLIAFVVGGKFEPGNGFAIVGAHTDSPCFKLKLISKKTKCGYLQVGTECYGGGIWHTWFDRDLSVAGRVLLKQGDKLQHRLVHINKPILRIPNLAIHLNRETNEKFGPNKETQMVPILATNIKEKLLTSAKKDEPSEATEEKKLTDKHHPLLIDLITQHLGCQVDDICDIELQLIDTQPAVIGGALDEFIFGGRLDNQVGSYCAIKSLIESSEKEIEGDDYVRLAAIYDHEEVGSESATGAASALTEHVLRRLSSGETDSFELAVSRSFLVSCDQAHAVHPNYSEYHEENHRPSLNGGVVIKYNGNQRYATNTASAGVIREAARLAQVPVQDFMVKNDSPCGSTIGPILSARLGMTTVDIGGPQLSMHSIRETGSTLGISQLTALLASFYRNYSKVRSYFSQVL